MGLIGSDVVQHSDMDSNLHPMKRACYTRVRVIPKVLVIIICIYDMSRTYIVSDH